MGYKKKSWQQKLWQDDRAGSRASKRVNTFITGNNKRLGKLWREANKFVRDKRDLGGARSTRLQAMQGLLSAMLTEHWLSDKQREITYEVRDNVLKELSVIRDRADMIRAKEFDPYHSIRNTIIINNKID